MDEEQVLANISPAEQERLVRRAAWSLPIYVFAILQVLAGLVFLFAGDAAWLGVILSTVFWIVIAAIVSPNMKDHGEDVMKVVYSRAMGRIFGTVGKVVTAFVTLMLLVWAWGQIDTVKEKAANVYDVAVEAVTPEPEPVPEPEESSVADELAAERLEIEKQRLELEKERRQLESDRAEPSQPVAQEQPTTVMDAPVSGPTVDPEVERQREKEEAVAKAIDWLVPYLDRLTKRVEYDQYREGKWIADQFYDVDVVAINGSKFRIDLYGGRSNNRSGSSYERSWSEVDTRYLRDAEIKCSEYDVRPKTCLIIMRANRGIRFDGDLGRCNDSGCFVSLNFYQKDMSTAVRIENALDDIVDLQGNREPY